MRAVVVGGACVLLATVAVGCGSSAGSGRGEHGMMGGSGGMMGQGATTSAPAPTGTRDGTTDAAGTAQADGRAVFLASGCGSCHTLAAAGADGTVGPDLDRARPSYARVVEQVTQGGGGMPSFSGSLSAARIRAVARYVSAAAGR